MTRSLATLSATLNLPSWSCSTSWPATVPSSSTASASPAPSSSLKDRERRFGVVDEGVDELVSGRSVLPVTRRLARALVVVVTAKRSSHLFGVPRYRHGRDQPRPARRRRRLLRGGLCEVPAQRTLHRRAERAQRHRRAPRGATFRAAGAPARPGLGRGVPLDTAEGRTQARCAHAPPPRRPTSPGARTGKGRRRLQRPCRGTIWPVLPASGSASMPSRDGQPGRDRGIRHRKGPKAGRCEGSAEAANRHRSRITDAIALARARSQIRTPNSLNSTAFHTSRLGELMAGREAKLLTTKPREFEPVAEERHAVRNDSSLSALQGSGGGGPFARPPAIVAQSFSTSKSHWATTRRLSPWPIGAKRISPSPTRSTARS
jgi:hypothetical protein